jgi:tetratricopeptide (TPR) repeat protein
MGEAARIGGGRKGGPVAAKDGMSDSASTPALGPEVARLLAQHEQSPHSRVFAALADAYRKADMVDEAIEVCRQGLIEHPHYSSAHLVLARCYQQKKMVALAREEFEAVVRLDPANQIALRAVAEIALAEGDLASARRAYQGLLDLDPLNGQVRKTFEWLTSVSELPRTKAPEFPEPGANAHPARAVPDQAPGATPESDSELVAASREIETAPVIGAEMAALTGEVLLSASPGEEVPPPAPGPPIPAPTDLEHASVTLAELYVRQGFLERALAIYEKLSDLHPDDAGVRARLEDLRSLVDFSALPQEAPPDEGVRPSGQGEETPSTETLIPESEPEDEAREKFRA